MALQDSSAPVLSGTDNNSAPLNTSPEVTDSGVVLQRRGAQDAAAASSMADSSMPITGGISEPAPIAAGPVSNPPTSTTPIQPGRPWQGILQGALWGLAGAAQKGPGRGGFAAGLGMGAANAQQMQFASVKAADDHIRAQKEQELLDLQTEEGRLGLQLQYQNIAALNKLFHLTPDGSFSAQTTPELHTKANGALQTAAAASPDGKLGRVQTYGSPVGGAQKNHIVDYTYPPTLQDFQQNEQGMHDFVAEGFKADGKTLLPNWWETGGGKVTVGEKPNAIGMLNQQQTGQSEMFMDAQKRLYAPFGGKEIVTTGARTPDQITSMNSGSSASLNQQAVAYDKLPDANPTVSKLLHGQATNFDAAVDNYRDLATKGKIAGIAATAPSEAAASALKTASDELAKEGTPGGQAALAEKKAQTEKAIFETGQLKSEAADIANPDLTGFTTTLNAKEYDKRADAFTKSKQYTTLQTLQGSYQQFQSVLGDISSGKGMTGGESVVGLFNAIGISATPLAGKGMRINQNTVEEHVGARGIEQSAYQKLLSLKNGDVITPQQMKDYATIATQVYRDAFVNAVNDAHSQGLKATFLPKGNNQVLDVGTASIYLRLSGGDLKKAQAMALANGWKF